MPLSQTSGQMLLLFHCSVSHVRLFMTPWTVACQASWSLTISQSLPKFMSVESVMPSNHLLLCHPLLLFSIFPSIRVFSKEQAIHIRQPMYWIFSFSISPSNQYSRLISFSVDWFDLLAVQGTLKNLLQHHSLKASILWCSAFFTVPLSHPYMTIEKSMLLLLSHFRRVRLCVTPQTAAHQAPLSLGFSRQEYWSGFPFPSPMHESEK